MTVMGDADVNGFSDVGSIPTRSIQIRGTARAVSLICICEESNDEASEA